MRKCINQLTDDLVLANVTDYYTLKIAPGAEKAGANALWAFGYLPEGGLRTQSNVNALIAAGAYIQYVGWTLFYLPETLRTQANFNALIAAGAYVKHVWRALSLLPETLRTQANFNALIAAGAHANLVEWTLSLLPETLRTQANFNALIAVQAYVEPVGWVLFHLAENLRTQANFNVLIKALKLLNQVSWLFSVVGALVVAALVNAMGFTLLAAGFSAILSGALAYVLSSKIHQARIAKILDLVIKPPTVENEDSWAFRLGQQSTEYSPRGYTAYLASYLILRAYTTKEFDAGYAQEISHRVNLR